MFDHVIVGVDGREGGRDAIALAGVLGSAEPALTLACVYPGEPVAWRGSSAAYEATERERVRELLERVREETGVEAQLRELAAPSVGRGLHELAELEEADLLVVGSSRRGLLGRVLAGDDTRAVIRGARCPVAIAPAGYAQHPTEIREVGVGYDGSPESQHALGVARRLADGRAKLSAFEAVAFPANALAGAPIPDGTIEELIDAARERVAALEGVEPHAAYGQPAAELALFSASLDLLVIGSRSYGPLGRLVHGSTAQQLARSARCPLLVLTQAARKSNATPALAA